MKSTRRFFLRSFSKSSHSKRIYYSSAADDVVSDVVGIKIDDDLDFPEYDPTPYGGGYDLASTYGEPLPPSDTTCYPPSRGELNSSAFKGFSYGSVPSPYGKEDADHGPPRTGVGVTRSTTTDGGKEKLPSANGNVHSGNNKKPLGPDQAEEESHGWGHVMPETQTGMDDRHLNYPEPYADPFGNWFWSSQEEEENNYDANKQSTGDQWQGTAEYLFGFSNPYGESRDEIHSYGDPIYAYEKQHSHEQSHYGQDEYSQPSWFQEPTYYEDYQEEEYAQSKHASTDVVPSYYYEDYQEEEYAQSKYISTDIVPTYYYEDYQEEEYTQSKYVKSLPAATSQLGQISQVSVFYDWQEFLESLNISLEGDDI